MALPREVACIFPPIPQGLIPVTIQQDPPKPHPAIPPVAPTQAGAGSDGVTLHQEHDEESWPEEEHRRHQHRQDGEVYARDDEGDEAPADEAGESARTDESPRKG